ncbi:MAG: EF-hand domain-containing protein [Clostridia bacterium]|nr:EF-hand domain-containing protein [Clostridia bacterium]
MKKNANSTNQENVNLAQKKIIRQTSELTNSYINGYITLNDMINIAKKFGIIDNLTSRIYELTVNITDGKLDGQISAKEYNKMYKQATKGLTTLDTRFLNLSHSILYTHDRKAIIR